MRKLIESSLSNFLGVIRFCFRASFFGALSITLIASSLAFSISVNALEESSLIIDSAPSQENVESEPLADNETVTIEDIQTAEPEKKVAGYPDFLDDQVFPFVAGLDSYE